jgi:hypothetical protein
VFIGRNEGCGEGERGKEEGGGEGSHDERRIP